MAGIYIHIPFCKQACYYCDFHFSTNNSIQSALCAAICQEIEFQKDYLEGEPIETIYFGGGTPSLLTEKELELIVNTIHRHFPVIQIPEITLEANPDDLTTEKLLSLKKVGMNRLSIGIQSLNDEVLKFLNRSHNAHQGKEAIQEARNVGFDNISVDLIYAIPNRGAELLIRDLDELLQLTPEHISAYSLTIEKKTVFGKWSAAKKFSPSSEEENASQFELIMDKLSQAGYNHYEISNYAKPNFISRHNSNYWRQKKYLGGGPSAHSFDGRSRQSNVANNYTYLNSIQTNAIPATKEVLTKENQINEYIMTSLRTSWGCDLNFLVTKFQYDLIKHQQPYINSCVSSGLMILDNGSLRLTRQGKMHADKLSADLFLIP